MWLFKTGEMQWRVTTDNCTEVRLQHISVTSWSGLCVNDKIMIHAAVTSLYQQVATRIYPFWSNKANLCFNMHFHLESLAFSSKVTPHKNGHSHHNDSISIHSVLPHRGLADVRQLLRFLRLVGLVGLGGGSATEPTNQTTDDRIIFLFLNYREEWWDNALILSHASVFVTNILTCAAVIILPLSLLSLPPGSSPVFLLLPVQILPLLFGMTQAEHQTMELKGRKHRYIRTFSLKCCQIRWYMKVLNIFLYCKAIIKKGSVFRNTLTWRWTPVFNQTKVLFLYCQALKNSQNAIFFYYI